MHALITLSPHKPAPVRKLSRSKGLMLALLLASLAVAGMVMPFVWNMLGAINELPKMAWLQSALAVVPVLSWLLMFAWGIAVPVALVYALYHPQSHAWRNALLVAALMLAAVTWYVHMPAATQCLSWYAQPRACSALQWGFNMSLGIATAAYVFIVFILALSALGLAAESIAPPRED